MLNAITIQDPFAVGMNITLIPHVGYTEELLFSGCFPATGKAMVLHWKLNGLIRCSWMPGLFGLNWLVCYIVVAIVTLTFHILGKTLCFVCIWMYAAAIVGLNCWIFM